MAVQRLLLLAALEAACIPEPRPPTQPNPPRAKPPPRDPVVDRAGAALEAHDLARARKILEAERWLARDRARAALLLCGCLLAQGDHAAAMDALREYLAKTTDAKSQRDWIAIHLLRHHASGGGKKARSAEEAVYFGLYALHALKEPGAADPDLKRALRDAPFPERYLARLALDGAGR